MSVILYRGPEAVRMARKAAEERGRYAPLRAPHFSSSRAAITGRLSLTRFGSLQYQPGEIGLADRGVLLLTDLPEFPREVVEAVGHALRHGVQLYDGRRSFHVPVHFSVIATAEHCPCGQRPGGGCRCSPESRARFDRRVRWAMAALRGEPQEPLEATPAEDPGPLFRAHPETGVPGPNGYGSDQEVREGPISLRVWGEV